MQDRRREAGAPSRSPGRRAAGCGRRRAGRAAPAAASRRTSCPCRARGRGARPASDEPRSPPQPPSPLTKIDERVVHSRSPDGEVATPSCQITAALPLSQISLIRVVTVAEPDGRQRAGDGDRLRAVHDLGEVDVAARQVERRRVGRVERRRHDAERRQHLQARRRRACSERRRGRLSRADAEVVEQHVALGPARSRASRARRRSRRRGRWASGLLRRSSRRPGSRRSARGRWSRPGRRTCGP